MKSRKWLAIVLVLAMCISMFPAVAYAEEEEPALQEEIQNEEMLVPEDNTPEQGETVEEDTPPEEPEAGPEPGFENIDEGSLDGVSPVLPLENGNDPEEQISAAEENASGVSAPEMTLIQEAEAAEETEETTVETSGILAYPVLTMNVETAAVVSAGGAEAYFRFVPTETKTYRFCSASESDTFGILYDAEMNEIDTDDNGGEEENFCVVSELFSGITYVFGARYVNPDETGNFLVTIADVLAENTAEESASETDTPEQGFSDFTTEVKQSAMLNGTSGFSAAADGDDHITVLYGSGVTMKVIATPEYSESDLHYQWYNPDGERVFDDDTDTCWLPILYSGGTFSCIVWEELYGERVNETTVEFVVSIKNNFSAFPVVDGYSDENENLDFYAITVPFNAVVTLEAVAHSDIGVNYEWFDDESPFPNGETGSKYTTPPITKYREFCCCASDDDYNSAYLNFDIYVDNSFSAEAEDSNPQVLLGESATLRVIASAASGSETLQYEWYDENGKIEGATGESYQTAPVMSQQWYYCRVTDPYDNTREIYFTVYIDNDLSAEAEDSNPQVLLGESATLRVIASAASGSETLQYEWYDADWNQIEGATTESYQTAPVMSRQQYYCRVTDPYDNTREIYFTVYIDNDLSAEAEDSNPQVLLGESATLRVIASAASGSETLQYEWYDAEWDQIEGATTESYQTAPVMSRQQYYCLVTDPYGNTTYVDFTVYIDNDLSAEAEDSNPQVLLGESATLRVKASAASGSETLQYEWYEWYDENWNPIEGATGESYQTAPVMSQQRYYCRVTDPYGNTTEVYFYVYVDNSFSAEAEDGTIRVAPGESATLRVKASAASGSETLQYEWYDDNWNQIEGATTESYQTAPVMSQQWYYCLVTDPYGDTREVDFYVTVDNEFRADYANGDGGSLSVPAGEQAELKVEAFAKTGYLHYQWFGENGKIEGATADTFLTPAITSYQEFKCAISDDYGNGTWLYFHVHVDNGFSVRAVGETERDVAPGAKTTLEVTATANQGDFEYHWYDDYEEIPGATRRSFETPAIDYCKHYFCIVTDIYTNSIRIDFYINVDNGFSVKAIDRFGQESRNVTVYVPMNGQTTLEVIATCSTGELTYQWYGNNQGSDVSGNHTPTLEIREVNNCQYYSCHVEDEFGNSGEVSFEISVENGFSAYVKGTSKNFKEVLVEPGSDYICEVDAKADQGEISYFWNWGADGEWQSQEGTSSLTLQNIQRFTNAWCLVEDMFGNYKDISFYISIQNHLSIYANNENSEFARVMVPLHGNAELSVRVEADDTENLKYEWYKTSKTEDYYDRTLVASGVDRYSAENMTGYTEYSCVVTDRYGNQATASFEVFGSDLNLSPNSLTLAVGQTRAISAAGNGALPIVWRSTDEEIAIVDNNGAITGKKVGFATITATAGESLTDCQVFVQFSDVTNPNDFFYEPIYQMVSYGVIGGWADGTFHPFDPCNRAAVVTFLWRLAGRPEPTSMAAFTDMPGDNIDFQKAISWAAENKITTGFVDGTFRPWDNCNRAAIVTFLWRYAGRPEPSGMAAFTDMPGDNIDFQKAISWAAENGITTGWDDGTFRPWNDCARLAVASFLNRYEKLL